MRSKASGLRGRAFARICNCSLMTEMLMGEFWAIWPGHGVGKILQFRHRHQVIEDADIGGPLRGHRLGAEKHLPGQGQAHRVDDVQDAGEVVRNPHPRPG